MVPEHIRELAEEWRADAATCADVGADGQAKVFLRCADDLEHMLKAGHVVTLAEAARLSGYSVDHLRKLVKTGVIPNRGKPHAPRIAATDVPRKAKRREAAPPVETSALPAGLESRLAS